MANRSKQERVEVDVYVEHKTGRAFKCIELSKLEDENPPEFWLPMSEIEIISFDIKTDYYKLSVPEWLAIEKGLV